MTKFVKFISFFTSIINSPYGGRYFLTMWHFKPEFSIVIFRKIMVQCNFYLQTQKVSGSPLLYSICYSRQSLHIFFMKKSSQIIQYAKLFRQNVCKFMWQNLSNKHCVVEMFTVSFLCNQVDLYHSILQTRCSNPLQLLEVDCMFQDSLDPSLQSPQK